MTRVCISIGILLMLVGTGIVSGIWVNKNCDDMLARLDVIAEERSSGEYEKASEEASGMVNEWRSFRKKALIALKNNKLSDIDRLTARIETFSSVESDDSEAESAELKRLLYALKRGELPYFYSVF